MVSQEAVFDLLGQKDYTPLDTTELAMKLNVPPKEFREFNEFIQRLEKTGHIARIRQNRYSLPLDADLVAGRILISRSGSGIVQPDDPKLGRILIPAEGTATALHMDRVLVRLATALVKPRPGDPEPTAKVLRVLERARQTIVGTLQKSEDFLYVVPDDPRIPHDIYVSPEKGVVTQAKVGDKVVVELNEWVSRHTSPEGQLIEVLGPPDQDGIDIESILRQYDLQPEFPEAVVTESERFAEEVQQKEWEGRVDCRAHDVVTIDPDDAKDFDDAFSLQRLPAGQWRLAVHIADVSYYVRKGTASDTEAERRGNSTYLVDRVIPMLPEKLSNNLCSLRPNVDRLTKCVEFLLDDGGGVLKTQYYSAVIHSRRRYTYKEAFARMQKRSGDPLDDMLVDANELAQKIRRARMQAGSLDMDFPENKIRLDERGRISHVERVENDASHQLIEEFMLLANEAVGARLRKNRIPSIYRIHELPDPERLELLRGELKMLNIRSGDLRDRKEVQRLLATLKAHPAGEALKITFLRSLKRARYAVEPLGHYGLAKTDYAHFTSPIRRYADLVVHRALFDKERLSTSDLASAADHISFTERKSADAEQDSKTVKLLSFLERQLQSQQLETYSAMVTEVRNFGFFVEISDLGFSGVVRVSAMEDDFYRFDHLRNQLLGRRHQRVISAGDRVKVQVATVDRFKKQANFKLVEVIAAGRKPAGKRTEGRGQRSEGRRTEGRPRRTDDRGQRTPGRRDGSARDGTVRRPDGQTGPRSDGAGRRAEEKGRPAGGGGQRRDVPQGRRRPQGGRGPQRGGAQGEQRRPAQGDQNRRTDAQRGQRSDGRSGNRQRPGGKPTEGFRSSSAQQGSNLRSSGHQGGGLRTGGSQQSGSKRSQRHPGGASRTGGQHGGSHQAGRPTSQGHQRRKPQGGRRPGGSGNR